MYEKRTGGIRSFSLEAVLLLPETGVGGRRVPFKKIF